jgi:hypothetical protein
MSGIADSRNIIQGVVRIVARIIFETLHRSGINLYDSLFGFLNWPEKKLRVKVFILRDAQGNAVCDSKDIEAAIDYAKRIFKKNFNVKLLPHRNGTFVGILQKLPPVEVLYTKGGVGALHEEFKIAGNFFASNGSGIFYPVTVFVVIKIKEATGCSLGPISDYVTVDMAAAKQTSVLAHELAHACGLWHINERSNLLYPYSNRENEIRWWQKNIFRSSRHVTYW